MVVHYHFWLCSCTFTFLHNRNYSVYNFVFSLGILCNAFLVLLHRLPNHHVNKLQNSLLNDCAIISYTILLLLGT